MSDPTRHPLTWPAHWPRTEHPKRSPFMKDWTVHQATTDVRLELKRLGATDLVISTNVELRKTDGMPRSNRRAPDDPGVAVYFKLEGQPRVLACDRWTRVADNMRAIAKHVDALRGQERWGVGTTAQAFSGYAALPAPEGAMAPAVGSTFEGVDWRATLELDDIGAEGERVHPIATAEIDEAFRRLAKACGWGTPDADPARMLELSTARDAARAEIRNRSSS